MCNQAAETLPETMVRNVNSHEVSFDIGSLLCSLSLLGNTAN